ncbi:hypothetical protein Anapl_04321 [Anas platyrhynchos]|uniref:Uncharacterized protein n=1 Tax=Anas platyrhynchos TaxID=8839 RepID=R0JHT0_ANAPL|nr:hypothetical protein Anapl_04321 [Anas platyrhynchos]
MVRNKVTLGQGAAAQPKGTQSKTVAFAGCELDARCFNGIHEAKVVSRKKRRNAASFQLQGMVQSVIKTVKTSPQLEAFSPSKANQQAWTQGIRLILLIDADFWMQGTNYKFAMKDVKSTSLGSLLRKQVPGKIVTETTLCPLLRGGLCSYSGLTIHATEPSLDKSEEPKYAVVFNDMQDQQLNTNNSD